MQGRFHQSRDRKGAVNAPTPGTITEQLYYDTLPMY